MSEFADNQFQPIMSRILAVRYADLEEEKALCSELMEKAEQSGDLYGQAFAHAYLGDYYAANNEVENLGHHLLQANEICARVEHCDELQMRIFVLLGIYYEHKGDAQSSIQNYLYADEVARRIGDDEATCMILNNIAFSFQRHNGMEEAFAFYEEAYGICKGTDNAHIMIGLINNLAETLIALDRPERARVYLEKLQKAEGDVQDKERLFRNNMCLYYAQIGERDECLKWAGAVFQNIEAVNADRMMAFENFASLFQAMMKIDHGEYAKRFFLLMEQSCDMDGLDQLRILEEARIEYCLRFEEQSRHPAAYKRFHDKMQEFKGKINKVIADAMKSTIYLESLKTSQEKLRDEQEDLRYESSIDELTGIYNRAYFDDLMHRCAKEAEKNPLAIIMLDVDYFKEYNDFYEHTKGDMVLKEVAACLRSKCTEGIHPCRYGGDEFVCVCEGIGREAVMAYIDAVRSCMNEKAIEHKKSRCAERVTFSIGFAIGADWHDPSQVMGNADFALYQSKQLGRNAVTEKRMEADE